MIFNIPALLTLDGCFPVKGEHYHLLANLRVIGTFYIHTTLDNIIYQSAIFCYYFYSNIFLLLLYYYIIIYYIIYYIIILLYYYTTKMLKTYSFQYISNLGPYIVISILHRNLK